MTRAAVARARVAEKALMATIATQRDRSGAGAISGGPSSGTGSGVRGSGPALRTSLSSAIGPTGFVRGRAAEPPFDGTIALSAGFVAALKMGPGPPGGKVGPTAR